MDTKGLVLKTCIAAFGLYSLQASALTVGLDYEFSGADSPEGPGPDWMTATFVDTGFDEVTLTISNGGLIEQEFVTEFSFNVGIDATALSFSHVSGDSSSLIETGSDAFKADGDGFFDILFSYNSSGDRFGALEESVYTITGSGLDALDFAFLSAPGGGNGSWTAAAHVQGIDQFNDDNAGSGWIGGNPVPVPAAVWLFGSGLLGLVGVARRKRA